MAVVARGQISIRVATDTYALYQGVDKSAISCDHTGKVLSTHTIHSILSVRCGDTPITNFSIGAIATPVGFYSISVNQSTKTISYTISGNNTTLADTGTISIPVIINGHTFTTSFSWFKVKAGVPGSAGVDSNLLDWVADWNSGKTVIDAQSVITPKIFAGTKNANGTLTGMAIGRFSLSTRNASGVIASETVNGIYGFNDGKKTFAIDATGNVQLGNGNEYIKYNTATGKVEFGSAVALAWVGATYIDANGIFTGSLSANTVNAIRINATQITAGTISADRIDVNALKASLITAGNIEALTLNVVRGKIGGWSLDSDSIFRGTKNNISGGFTAASGSITIASNGIRGFKWRLESTGAGAIAGGNILWDAAGTVTFASSVSLNWTAPISNITTALGGSSYTKLTQISSTGIYTGTLTASQITAGTIDTARLNVDALKATLVTAGNINALTLTVNKGTIGGWIINSASISGGQIVLDKANKRIVVYGASSSATSGNRVQLYHNSNTDFGLFAADTAGSTVVQLGYVNRIAGWTINSTQIYKNSVYLGADGSITNGSKWRLNNDGSGQIASGNIAWNALGNVTFGASVSLLWKNDIASAQQANFGYPYYQSIVINGDANTYYPVIIKGGDQNFKREILVRRAYSEQAPDTWNTATHKGGLVLHLKTNFGGWGGINYSWDIYELSETYCRMFAGALHCGNYCMFAIFLRGGGTTGARYHLYSNQPLVSSEYSPSPIPASPQIAYNSEVMFQSGSTTVNAPAPRTLTTAVEEEIRRRRFIGLAQGSDSTLSAHPLTYISSTGIYTGTLTANQVNAVGINASSITTGTLSADRIAAGSISSAKLDAASIKANIINVNYINGLSCTFVRGKIGGFTIGSDNMTVGTIGTVGTTPIQIRTAASGSGYWYAGAYKPMGISLLWYQSSNAGHIVFGQVAASGSSVKTGFVGIQMMSWDGYEYFCLSANSARSGSKEVYNRIAGWAFDSANIWKNSVYLGSDGSIYNGTKWRLGNDGSGRVANGNIVWDAAGNVSFGSSVSLNWNTPINNIVNALGGSTFPKTTYITSSGIYTGILTASQITTGTLSADRIAAGSINSSKLDAASIKANIINTAYINGLSCTFNKGTIGGWSINSVQIYKNSVALSSDGSIVNGTKWKLNNDGSGQLANGNIFWDSTGNVQAKNAIFTNVRVNGSVRNKFVLNDSSIWIGGDTSNQQNFNNYDNIVAIRGSWDENIDLPWTIDNSGRRVTLVNYKWGSNTTVGYMTIYAPYGKYFFEDGMQKPSITFSRELIELLGYGDNSTFFGWIVINRRDIMTTGKYGSYLQCLASGIVTLSGTSASIKQKTFDGTKMTISRTGTGRYTVYLPWYLSSNYFVQMTGYYTGTPIYATIMGIYGSYFYVQTQDDDSANEGSFCFQVFSTADWS